MPRPNRFQPSFAERSHQSRVARGLERPAQVEAPAERSKFQKDWGIQPSSETGAKPMEHFHIPLSSPAGPETGLIHLLQMGAAQALTSIQYLREFLPKVGQATAQMADLRATMVNTLPMATAEILFTHTLESTHTDTLDYTIHWDSYPKRKRIYINGCTLRYAPVLNALKQLDAELNLGLPLEELVPIESLEDHLADRWFVVPNSYGQPRVNVRSLPCPLSALQDCDKTYPGAFSAFTPLWQVREQWRLRTGEYVSLPQSVLDVLPPEVIDSQIPHLAVKPGNAGMVAYTASPAAGATDRQQVMKAGRYVRQHCPHLSDEQVKQLAAEVMGALDTDIHMSHEADDFARVYINGPSSCMGYDESGKMFDRLMVDGGFFHPTRVYAHPENNIRIVWVENGGRISARAVVNTKTKRYPSIYASDGVAGARRKLKNYLEVQGFEQADDALYGEKLLKVSPDDYPGAIICPYIDLGNIGVEVYNDHLVVGGGYGADHETGCLTAYNTQGIEYDGHCNNCGGGFNEDDEQHYTNLDEAICEHCASNNYTWAMCADSGDYSYYYYDGNTFYHDLTPGNRSTMVVMDNNDGSYVHLWEDHYTDSVVDADYAIYLDDEDEYILEADASRFGYAYLDDGWYAIKDFAVLDGELVRREDIPDEAELCPLLTDSEYPQLPVYQTPDEDDQEAA